MDGTPVYDIKPYLPYADSHPEAKGGFTDRVGFNELTVNIPDCISRSLDGRDLENIRDILKQDPRTRHIHDDERIWGISYSRYNIRFKIAGERLDVIQIQGIEKIKADAVFLDVDGTLWDSTPLVAGAWSRALKETGIERQVMPEELKKLFGKPMDVIAAELLPDIGQDVRDAVMEKCIVYEQQILEENEKDISYPGVKETIRKLAGKIPVCIVSNCQSGYIELVMRKLGIEEYISDKECYGDTLMYKADNIRLVAERNGYKAPVYVGDIQGDQDASHEAGAAFIHAAYGFGSADAPEAVIGKFSQLTDILL
ncbi:MAG: HAD hydrolase-like protein [Lachnospiraceae bacterium]|nr:HAD hydrolase-like protein [Lachnospiraceae bacterium]